MSDTEHSRGVTKTIPHLREATKKEGEATTEKSLSDGSSPKRKE